MNLDELIGNYEIHDSSPIKFHDDLLLFYDFSKYPMFSLETERKILSVRESKICQDYNINYSTFLSNLKLLTQYCQSSNSYDGVPLGIGAMTEIPDYYINGEKEVEKK